jgi:signal transduction histidine kinase
MNQLLSFALTAMRRKPLRFVAAIIWLFFTLSLLGWWIYFGFYQVDRLSQLGYPDALELARFQRMLMWEGGTLIALIVLGGVIGLYLLARELRTQAEIRSFFAAFTHELRTSLSSLLLKIEGLESLPREARALSVDVERIRLQLDNALFATVSAEGALRRESLVVVDVVRRVAERFSELSVAVTGDVNSRVKCDARGLESMLSNLFSNALLHGKAGGVTITIDTSDAQRVELTVVDDGTGFTGSAELVAKRFVRHYEGSGTGLGLSITKELAQRSGGSFRWELDADRSFKAILSLPSDHSVTAGVHSGGNA